MLEPSTKHRTNGQPEAPRDARPTILILEQDAILRRRFCRILVAAGVEVVDAADERQVSASIPSLDLAIVGSSSRGALGSLDAARWLRRSKSGIPIIFVTPHSSEQLAVAALRLAVNDYFAHPVPFAELMASIWRCLGSAPPPRGRPSAAAELSIIGHGPKMRAIRAYIERVAATDSTVLITGETGTGKELAAELLHRSSPRRQKPFIRINCAAIPDTLLESELFGYERGAFTGAQLSNVGKMKLADGGTVLFDEIGDMTLHAQAKILRLIESKEIERLGGGRSLPVNVRVIAATNQDLERLMAEGRFRKDLYFRLNVARIHLPALRDRMEDFPQLLEHYIQEFCRLFDREVGGVGEEALASLLRHDWPGNIRELKNVVEAVLATLPAGPISLQDLPEAYRRDSTVVRDVLPEAERDRLLAVLTATHWNKSKAAARLHWSRMTIYRKMAKYHLVGARPTRTASGRTSPASRDLSHLA